MELAFTEMIYDFPRMKTLADLTFLRQKVHRLETEQQTWFPHRVVKRGSANEKERISTQLHVPSLFQEQASWLQRMRKIRFDVIPEGSTIPATIESTSQRPTYLIVHLFSGRRRNTDIHAWIETYARRRVLQSKCCH